MEIFQHEIMYWLTLTLIIILGLFMLSTFINFIRKKKKATLYLALNYLSFIGALILFYFGHLDVVNTGAVTKFYFDATMFANAFIVAGILVIILFHEQFIEISKTRKYIALVFGMVLIIWILVPLNYETPIPGEFHAKFITYTLMTIYGALVYAALSYSFFKLTRVVTQKRVQLIALGIGSLLFLAYYINMTIYGILQDFFLMAIGMAIIFSACFSLFIGIYLPKFVSKK